MFKENISILETELKKLDGINYVGRYKMEFEENSPADVPKYPCALTQFIGFANTARTKSGMLIKTAMYVKLFIANKSMSEAKGLEFAESIIEAVNEVYMEGIIGEDTIGINVSIADDGFKFLGYKGSVDIYTLELIISN